MTCQRCLRRIAGTGCIAAAEFGARIRCRERPMTAQAYKMTATSSLPVDLALREEGPFSGIQRIDRTERAISDRDYWSINPEGYLLAHLRDTRAGVEPATRSTRSNLLPIRRCLGVAPPERRRDARDAKGE